MKIPKRIPALLFAIFLIFSMGGTAFAHEAPDMEKTGSVSVAMTWEGKAVPGGSLTLYRVGDVSEEDGNYSFVLSDAFTGSGAALNDLESAELTQSLAGYAAERKLTGATVAIGSDGKAVAGNLELGLYLVVQTQAAEGFDAIAPFLVSVPMYEGGVYLYDVNATPKMSALTEAKPTPDPEPKPAVPTEPTLPQAGQLNWPVPVMVVLGLCLLLIGWALRYGRKEQPNEA